MHKIACIADVHIGRSSSVFESASALNAFHKAVDCALAGDAKAILIAGDLFDNVAAVAHNRAQVTVILRKAKAKAIPVIAVAGNHDWEGLHEYAKSHPELISLIGRDQWETVNLGWVNIVGRSFTAENAKNLLDGFVRPAGKIPVIGLVHADIGAAAASPYNPVSLADLSRCDVNTWVVGHVHIPRTWDEPSVCYTGSLQALDPGETGIHGFRWLDVMDNSVAVGELETISTVRYETIRIYANPDAPLNESINKHVDDNNLRTTDYLALRVHVMWIDRVPDTPPDRVYVDDTFQWNVVSDEVKIKRNLIDDAKIPDARGQAARLLLGIEALGLDRDDVDGLKAESLILSTRGQAAQLLLGIDSRDDVWGWKDAAEKLVGVTVQDIQSSRRQFQGFRSEVCHELHAQEADDRASALDFLKGALSRIASAGENSA